ncbi:MAG: LD-carboxypeptidase [Pirellulaceae bacterium]|nr:LD-carboxypeptidase [Pirellulaceae bacterium]
MRTTTILYVQLKEATCGYDKKRVGWWHDLVCCVLVVIHAEIMERAVPVFRAVGLLFVLGFSSGFVLAEEPSKPVRPPGLQQGDTIMLVAPSGSISDERIEMAKEQLLALGYRIRVQDDATNEYGYLAGDDARRAAELMSAFRQPDVAAVFPMKGGYGATRILDRLDYEVIRQNPKILVGYSDITALHLALAAKANLVTFHSPNGSTGFAPETGMNDYAAKYFWRSILADQNGESSSPIIYESPAGSTPIGAMRPGMAQGRLTGGNLTLISSLMGTSYEIQTTGRVVFLEDVGEAPYRIDRYLSQLKLAGKLRDPAAVILGQFTDCDADAGLSLQQVFKDYFGDVPYPVITNFPAGHVSSNATLPMGTRVEVDADQRRVTVLQNPVSSRRVAAGAKR